MENIIEKITANWHKNLGVNQQEIFIIENNLDIVFPIDYKIFLNWSNGGEGEVGGNYISLWRVEDILTLNNDYQIQKYLSKSFLAIGTDGGGICYGFNIRDNFSFFKCPLGDLDVNEVSLIARSFKGFLEKAIEEEI